MKVDNINSDVISSIINPQVHDGELRILDTDLAARLCFAKPVKIRDLIKRHRSNLKQLGPLPTVGRVINGGQATEYYLNKKQAIFLTTKSETAEATAITIEIIERFEAYERGDVKPVVRLRKPAFDTTYLRLLKVAATTWASPTWRARGLRAA